MNSNTLVSAAGLAGAMERGEVFVVDCSFDLADTETGRRAWAEARVPGARYLHLDEDLSSPPDGTNGRHPLPGRDAFAARLRALGLRRGMQVVAYDRSGSIYAARLWWMLRWLGHDAVAVLDGGFGAWRAAGLGTEAGEGPVREEGDFVADAPLVAEVASADEILADIGTGRLKVIDARDAARFRGDPHPLDEASGHIPGAVNRFCRDNLGPDGCFRPAGELRAALAPIIGGHDPAALVSQCGSGVTACHNLLALAIAGIDGARLYPGSWSEWTSDPARPVATGE